MPVFHFIKNALWLAKNLSTVVSTLYLTVFSVGVTGFIFCIVKFIDECISDAAHTQTCQKIYNLYPMQNTD